MDSVDLNIPAPYIYAVCVHCIPLVIPIGADSTGATGNFAPVLMQEPGQTLRFARVSFMAVLWFFKWTLQLYLLNLTKRAKFAPLGIQWPQCFHTI